MARAEMMVDEKALVRADVFAHLTGLVLVPVAKALWDRGVFGYFDESGTVSLDAIVERTRGNRGYLNIAMRLLASAGWVNLQQEHGQSPRYSLTRYGQLALRFAPPLFAEAASYIPLAIFFEDFLMGKSQSGVHPALRVIAAKARERWGIVTEQDPEMAAVQETIRRQLDGILVGPAMVALARGGVFDQLAKGPVDPKNVVGQPVGLQIVFDLLIHEGWLEKDSNGRLRLTTGGAYAAQIAASYGVTVSYLPMFSVISTLLFGNARIPRVDESGIETLCNRAMNVWGSGGAHKTYFKKVDEIVIEIFNRPIDQQPKGICDMGCGDATLLEHLYKVVKKHTERGKVLDQHPLILVGADYNKVARRVSSQRLRKAGIPTFHVIHGDINRPAQLAGDLEGIGLDAHDLLHIRSFLDHNRPYLPPAHYVAGTRTEKTTGAFAYLGDEIPADELEENLVRHLRRWAPFVGRFGLLLLELHTLSPVLAAKNGERSPAVAYDGTHGFSDQYLVEADVFQALAREAGLVADPRYQAKFPPNELATVTINYFTAPQAS
jgi:hypothetical protein